MPASSEQGRLPQTGGCMQEAAGRSPSPVVEEGAAGSREVSDSPALPGKGGLPWQWAGLLQGCYRGGGGGGGLLAVRQTGSARGQAIPCLPSRQKDLARNCTSVCCKHQESASSPFLEAMGCHLFFTGAALVLLTNGSTQVKISAIVYFSSNGKTLPA